MQDAESQALAAISVAKDRSDELEARLTKTQATYDAKIGELQAEANKLHNLKLEEERKRITKEFEASHAQTVQDAQKAVAAYGFRHRIVHNYKGYKRPEGIDSKLWQMLRTNERKKIIEEEDAKLIAKAQEGKPTLSISKSAKKKKSSVAQLEATQSPLSKATLINIGCRSLGKPFQTHLQSFPFRPCSKWQCLHPNSIV